MPNPSRPRLVFVTRRPPYPLDNGARIRAHQLLTGLSREFETVFVTYEHHPDSPDGFCSRDELERIYPHVELITVPGARVFKRARQAFSVASPRSWTIGRYLSPAFREAVATAVDGRRPCIVHFDELGAAIVGPQPGAVSVYASHNIEHRVLRLSARAGSAPRRLFNLLEAVKVHREEERVWRTMDLSLAVSEVDAQAMVAGGARHVEVCPNGASPAASLPLPPLSAGEPLRLLFVGTGNYAPYARGLTWFVSEALPRIRARIAATFDVVGDPPARRVEADGVRYLGRVPSVEPFYSRSHAVVVPIFEGSGTRLKIIEAMTLGRPVISTRLGAEGLPVSAGKNFFEADDAEGFAEAAASLADWLRRPENGDLGALLASAREAVEPLSWPRITEELVELYRHELASRGW